MLVQWTKYVVFVYEYVRQANMQFQIHAQSEFPFKFKVACRRGDASVDELVHLQYNAFRYRCKPTSYKVSDVEHMTDIHLHAHKQAHMHRLIENSFLHIYFDTYFDTYVRNNQTTHTNVPVQMHAHDNGCPFLLGCVLICVIFRIQFQSCAHVSL